MPVDTKVRSSTMDWATQVAMVRAREALDSGNAGLAVLAEMQKPVVYEFSNGREFREPDRNA